MTDRAHPHRHTAQPQVHLRQLRHRPVESVRARRGASRWPRRRPRPTTRSSSTATPASARRISSTPSATTRISLYSGIKVRYVSSEEFTNDFINSIANNRGSAFQARYRDVDILLIDDIQFLQEARRDAGGVLPHLQHAARPRQAGRHHQRRPTQAARPASRTACAAGSSGASSRTCRPPTWRPASRSSARRRRASDCRSRDEVLEYIAHGGVVQHPRAGGRAHPRLRLRESQPLDSRHVPRADRAARHRRPGRREHHLADRTSSRHTAHYFKFTVDDLYGSSRSRAVATARQIAMYLCRERTNLSLPKIGQLFGNRDHTTVMYAYKKISEPHEGAALDLQPGDGDHHSARPQRSLTSADRQMPRRSSTPDEYSPSRARHARHRRASIRVLHSVEKLWITVDLGPHHAEYRNARLWKLPHPV